MQSFKEKFEHEVIKQMRDLKVPGMSILITKDGKIIYERAFGLREKVKVKSATTNTLYGISSITKSFTCMAIMQLHEAKKLDINEPISKYLPITLGFKDEPILIKHVMSHASGIPSLHSFEFSQMNQELYEANIPEFPLGNWDDFYFHINDAKSELLFKPSTKFYYWNDGFTLLSQIIAKVSGKPYEEYVKEKILIPLGMVRSTFFKQEAENNEDVTRGFNYTMEREKLRRLPKDLLSGLFIAGSGGLISSVRELTNYLQCYLNNGEFNGKRILDGLLINEMIKGQNREIKSHSFFYPTETKASYGFGWKVYENYHGYTLATHSGVSGVTGGHVAIIPELKLTYAQLYNVSFLTPLLMNTALVLLFGKNHREAIPFYKRQKHYKTLCGKYEAYKKILTIDIKEMNGLLYLHDDNWEEKEVYPLIPKNNEPEVMDFYISRYDGYLDITFTKHKNDQITFDYERYILHKKTFEIIEE